MFISIITFIAVTLNKYYIHETSNNEAPPGNLGEKGKTGHDGDNAKILNSNDLCVDQMMINGNEVIKEFIKNKPDIIKNLINKDELLFKNLFMKRKYKHICESTKYKNLKSRIGEYNSIKKLNEISKKWVRIILNYQQGFNYLSNYFYIDKSWNRLLSKNKSLNENISPFKIIKTDKIWNW